MHRQYFCRMYLKVMGVSEDAGIKPRTVAKVSLVRRSANFEATFLKFYYICARKRDKDQ